MSDDQLLDQMQAEITAYNMADLRYAWRHNRTAWVTAMRNLWLRDAEWYSRIKWHVLKPEFDRRGKTP